MPDLGKYGTEILGAYAGGLAVLCVLLVLSVLRARRVRAQLDAAEERRNA